MGRRKGPDAYFFLIQRHEIAKRCDGPRDDGGDCSLDAVVTVHGMEMRLRNLCSHCLLEFLFGLGYCDAKVVVVP